MSKFRYEQDVKIQVQENDILISKDGTIGKVGIVRNQPFPATLNSGVFVIRAKNDKNQKGFSLAFVSDYFREFINRLTCWLNNSTFISKRHCTFQVSFAY